MNYSIELADEQINTHNNNTMNKYYTATNNDSINSSKMIDSNYSQMLPELTNLSTLLFANLISNGSCGNDSGHYNLSCDSKQSQPLDYGYDSMYSPQLDEINLGDHLRDMQKLVAIIVPICFGIIALTGFFGNVLVIVVVLFNQQMHSTTNLLIVNLAVADLLFVVFCIPFTAFDYITFYWPFGDIWCRTVQYLIVVTAFASIYTLVLMSVDRFLAVVHPIRSRMLRNEHVTKIAIVTLWAVILTITVPVLLTHGVETEYDMNANMTFITCSFMKNDFLTRTAYQIVFFVCSYLLPLMIISGLYVRMIMRLWRQSSGVRMSVESQRGRKRVTRLVVVVVIAFASMWLPIQVILLLKGLGVYDPVTKFEVILQIVAQILAYTSSCINPLLYAFLSDNFRKAFHKAIHCSRRYHSYTSDLPPPRKTSCGRTSTTGL